MDDVGEFVEGCVGGVEVVEVGGGFWPGGLVATGLWVVVWGGGGGLE